MSLADASAIRDFIERNLPLAPVPSVPEIRLHRACATSGLRRLARKSRTESSSPYWAYPWPGGLVLARHILDRPGVVDGRRVLDLGTGSGLVAIAAAKAGARSVIATDADPYAAIACELNARANDVVVRTETISIDASPPAVDLVLAGDVFYEPAFAARVLRFLEECQSLGIDVLIGDPYRASLPLARLRPIADYAVPEVGGSAADTLPSGVFELVPLSAARVSRECAATSGGAC